MNRFGEIGQNDCIWPKMTIFWPFFRPKWRNWDFSGGNFLQFFLRPKTEFLWEKLEKSYDCIWRNWSKWPFLGQNGHFWQFWGQNGANRIFFGKKRKCHFRMLIMLQLCARNQNKPMNGFWGLEITNGRTNGRTDGRTNESEFVGPNSAPRGTNKTYENKK